MIGDERIPPLLRVGVCQGDLEPDDAAEGVPGPGDAGGIAAALALVKTLRTLLYGVEPTDPVSFAVVIAALLAVALIACWLPTRAAMRVHPAVALRTE